MEGLIGKIATSDSGQKEIFARCCHTGGKPVSKWSEVEKSKWRRLVIETNPLSEAAATDSDDVALLELIRAGSRTALETLIRRHQTWIYNIALRMVNHP